MDKYRSELELDDPMEIWRRHIERELDAYMGLIFERVSRQAYFRMRAVVAAEGFANILRRRPLLAEQRNLLFCKGLETSAP